MKKLFFLFFLLTQLPIYATHLKGGNIQVSSVVGRPNTFEYTITLYGDTETGLRAFSDEYEVLLCLGDGKSMKAVRVNGNGRGEFIGVSTGKSVYKATYVYAFLMSEYRLSLVVTNRSGNIRNIPQSEKIPFYIETTFNPSIPNSTPILTSDIGIVDANVKEKFIYNPKAVDIDGDSLSYRLIDVRTGEGENCQKGGLSIQGFQQPNDIKKEGTFKLDALKGDIIWNAPTEIGLYSFAFIVEEWRNGKKISETVRDMNINVKDGNGVNNILPNYEPAGTIYPKGLVLGNNEVEYDDFIVYPNPTNSGITFRYHNNLAKKVNYKVFDFLGNLLVEHNHSIQNRENNFEIDLKSIPSGSLLLIIESGEKKFTKKIIKY